jgi:hypothetical protein
MPGFSGVALGVACPNAFESRSPAERSGWRRMPLRARQMMYPPSSSKLLPHKVPRRLLSELPALLRRVDGPQTIQDATGGCSPRGPRVNAFYERPAAG